MKKVNMFILLLLCFYSVSYSQIFFPTNVGNLYQMDNHWSWSFGGTSESGLDYYKYSIISDTLIDGLQYFKFSYKNLIGTNCYLRYDSLEQKLYRFFSEDTSVQIAVDFNIPADSLYTTYITGQPKTCKSNGMSYKTVFGQYVQTYSMQVNQEWYDIRKFFFADKFGLYYYESNVIYAADKGFGGGSNVDNLISAKIDSLIFNPISLSIDSVYPVIDRPVNTFPYLMWINHTESYQGLIDSFYIKLQHVRGDSVLATIFSDISITNSRTTIFFDNLNAGDVVQFKILLSDSSIFLNQDTYPDTDWIKINVLPAVTDNNDENEELNFSLSQNYPNPFNPSTTIHYAISSTQFVTLKVYDVLGKEVATLVNEEKVAGNYEVDFNVAQESFPAIASGIYFYQLKAGDYIETKKMILMK